MILDEILEILENGKEDKAYSVQDKTYTYDDLGKFVVNLYYFLKEKNPEKRPIIVFGSKDIYMKASFLACSFAGIAYIPIDETMPKARVENIIEQIKPAVIIGDFECENVINVSKTEIEDIMSQKTNRKIEKIEMKPDDIYYIIFTSGSTGKPKGVKVLYRNIDSCVQWLKSILNCDKQVVLNQASFSFDLSVADLYFSLVTRSEHFILEKAVQQDFTKLFISLKKSNANTAFLTPSFADMLLLDKSFGKDLMPNLNTILFCGETLLPKTVEKLYNRFGDIRIINAYGPTECTFAVTSIDINTEIASCDVLPVGLPKQDVNVYIIDENKKILENGKIGEILITGESVAGGYLEKNEAFYEFNGKNAYLTGDLGIINDGILYYKGRKDYQIKYKGYRMELSDIEQNLYKIKDVEKVAVIPKYNSNGKVNKIIAFILLKQESDKDEIFIKKELLKKLPLYMCPVIRILDEMPLNNNGKLDIKMLEQRRENGR